MPRGYLSRALLAVAVVAAAWPAYAQTPQPAPPQGPGATRQARGLFGGGFGETSQALMLTVALGGVYVKDMTSGGLPPRTSGTASGNLGYTIGREFGRLTVGGSAASNAHYYPAASDDVIVGHRASLNASFKLAERSRLSVHRHRATGLVVLDV